MGDNFLHLQITDLNRGMKLTRELEFFLVNLAVGPIVTFDLGETVYWYDRLLNWMSHHVSRTLQQVEIFLPTSRHRVDV